MGIFSKNPKNKNSLPAGARPGELGGVNKERLANIAKLVPGGKIFNKRAQQIKDALGE